MQDDDKPEGPLYRRLADRLTLAIRQGMFSPGDRLPSVRQCAEQQGLSLSTVLHAYKCLEDAHLIEVRPKAGHFVVSTAGQLQEPDVTTPPSASMTVDVASVAEMVTNSATSPHLVSFGPGRPSAGLFQAHKVQRALVRAAQHTAAGLCEYPQVPGDDQLRRAIARRALTMGCALDPREIVLTNGTTESISLCLQVVVSPGDIVALESPTSFGFLQVLQALRLRALEIPTHPRYGLSVHALALAMQTQPVRAVLAVPTLSNPLGASMPLTERKRLAQLLKLHQMPMIEDVIYNDLAERDEHRRAVSSCDRDGLVMLCSSYSKTVAPGFRVGWVHAGRFGPALRRLKVALSGGHTPVVERAMAELLAESSYGRQLRRLRELIARNVSDARRLIGECFPRGTRVTDPTGGMMLWVELPPKLDSLALFKACLDEHIVIAPGTMFSATDSYRNCIRLSIGGEWGDPQRHALRRIGALAAAM